MGKIKKYKGALNMLGRHIHVEVKRGKLTSIGPEVKLTVKDTGNIYKLLPKCKIFICFSGNTAEDVVCVQSKLLMYNLDLDQRLEWVPVAWNVLPPINARGTGYDAQDVINTYIEKADHILFIVKDFVADGLKSEWVKFSSVSNIRKVHLGIFENDNTQKVHNELDPFKQFIHFSFKDYRDIILYLEKNIHPDVILTGYEQKLNFVRTKEELNLLQTQLRGQLATFKHDKVNDRIISGMEMLINSIDQNGTDIINKNRTDSLNASALIRVEPVLKLMPHLTPIKHGQRAELIKGAKCHQVKSGRKK